VGAESANTSETGLPDFRAIRPCGILVSNLLDSNKTIKVISWFSEENFSKSAKAALDMLK